jgi:hypothetical protein
MKNVNQCILHQPKACAVLINHFTGKSLQLYTYHHTMHDGTIALVCVALRWLLVAPEAHFEVNRFLV